MAFFVERPISDLNFGNFNFSKNATVYFRPHNSYLLNGLKLIPILINFVFFYGFFHAIGSIHSFFRIISYQSFLSIIFSLVSIIASLIGSAIRANWIFLQLSLYCDLLLKFFSISILYPLVFNQLLENMQKPLWRKVFKKTRVLMIVSLCLLIASIASVILIQTSNMTRIYVREIGFLDIGETGFQMLINRIFYIFPIGSIICYVVLYFHIRRVSQQVMSRRTAESGRQRIFIQLFITVLFYGAMCLLYEFLNSNNWANEMVQRIDLVGALNIINYLPEISLPLMLLLSNTDMKRRISDIIGSHSNTISVIPVH